MNEAYCPLDRVGGVRAGAITFIKATFASATPCGQPQLLFIDLEAITTSDPSDLGDQTFCMITERRW